MMMMMMIDDDDGDDDAYRRPQLGLDLSNVFTPLVNFAKLSGKSFETFATMLEKQANLLLGKIAFSFFPIFEIF